MMFFRTALFLALKVFDCSTALTNDTSLFEEHRTNNLDFSSMVFGEVNAQFVSVCVIHCNNNIYCQFAQFWANEEICQLGNMSATAYGTNYSGKKSVFIAEGGNVLSLM